jgi:hypothetical protein
MKKASNEPSNEHGTPVESLPPVRRGAPGRPATPRYKEQYGVVVVCGGEEDQRAVYAGLLALGRARLKVVCT